MEEPRVGSFKIANSGKPSTDKLNNTNNAAAANIDHTVALNIRLRLFFFFLSASNASSLFLISSIDSKFCSFCASSPTVCMLSSALAATSPNSNAPKTLSYFTPSARQRSDTMLASGTDEPLSHRDTAWRDT